VRADGGAESFSSLGAKTEATNTAQSLGEQNNPKVKAKIFKIYRQSLSRAVNYHARLRKSRLQSLTLAEARLELCCIMHS
jgi:hypothetical protein